MNDTSKKWTPQSIKELLTKSDKAVMRAVVRIYSLQTYEEQKLGETREANKIGFNGPDSKILTYYAKWILQNGELTGKHVNHARNRITKYSGQLARIANQAQ